MYPIFTKKLIALITLSLVATTLSAINFKTDLKKETNNASSPFWQQPHAPDYVAELQKYNPSKKEPDKQLANEFMANAKQNVSFLENKGQMMDTEGKPVPFVLFKAEAPGMNVYITEKGLTYVFVKIEEEEKEERKRGKNKDLMLPGKHDEKLKTEMAWINVNLKGASIKRENIIKEEQSAEHFNYFYGHCPNGIYDVYQYKKLTIKNVYPKIDWVFYNSSKGGMKYDFIVNPGANPNDIKLIYDSETPLDLDKNGNLQLKTKLGSLTENAPYSYIQENNTEVKSSFKTTQLTKHKVEVTFALDQSTYTQASTLVIDPQLVWGTFYGGSNNDASLSIDTDGTGNVFVTGTTSSTNFPLQNAGTFFQTTLAGNFYDVFILKFSNSGNLLWATYYGGSGDEGALFIDSDSSGNIFVAGSTDSSNFPLLNAGAGTFFQGIYAGNRDAFILKFTNNGTRLWATYYGGANYDIIVYISEDLNGNVFFTGSTFSSNFPLQNAGTFFQGAFSGGTSDGFILKFSNNGNLLWATYYGGSGDDDSQSICTDSNGNVFVAGSTDSPNFPVLNAGAGTFFQGINGGGGTFDAFILKFDNSGNRLWATYYGGSSFDFGRSILTDSNGNVFVSGATSSLNFPLQNAGTFFQGTYSGVGFDAFILKFDNAGNRLWATYFGGSGNDRPVNSDNFDIDNCNNVYFGFETDSTSFPHLLNSTSCSYLDNSYNGGISDNIIARFTNNGSLTWCTYLGGNGYDNFVALDIDLNSNLYISGQWSDLNVNGSITNSSYPLVNPSGGAYFDNTYNGGMDDGYIIKFSPALSYTNSSVQASACNACDGSATFSITCGEAPYSYVWSNGISVLNTTVTTSGISNLCPGVYNVTVTSACTQTLAQSYTINWGAGVAIIPTASVLPSNSLCPGQSLTLTSVAATSHTWAGPNNFVSNLQDPTLTNVAFANAGVYTVNVTSADGCVSSTTVNLVVNPLPTVSASLSNSPCQGQNVILVGTSNVVAFQWSGPNNFVSNQQSPTLTNLQLNNNGVYTLNVTSASGCVNSATVNLVVNPPPTVSASVSTSNACQGQSLSLIGTSTATAFQWSGPNNYNSAVQSPTLTNVALNNSGVYTLNVTSASGCVNSTTVSLVVNPLPAVSASLSNSACQGQSLSLVGTSTATNFQWAGPNNFASNQQSPTLTNVALNNGGVYTLNVTSANSCVNSATVNLVVNPPPSVLASASSSTACQGQSLSLNGTSNVAILQWVGPNNFASNLQNPTLTNVALNNSGVYTLNATSANGCVNAATVNFVVIPQPTVTALPSSTSACHGQSLSLIGTSNATTFQWAGTNNYSSDLQSPTLTNLQLINAGVYTLNVTSPNGCVNSATVNLVVMPLPSVSASLSNSPCYGQNVSLVGTSNANTYQWTGPNNFSSILQNPLFTNLQFSYNGVYILNVTSANGCFNSTSIILQVNPQPTVSASASSSSACQGQSVSLVASGNATVFQWSGPNNYNSTGQTVSIQNLQLNQSGVYNLSVTSLQGCTNTTSVNFTVNPNPQAVILSNAVSACPPLCASYSFVPTADVASYTWLVPNRSTIANTPIVQTCYTSPGTYTMQLEVKGTNGCAAKGIYSLQVYPKPIADFVFNPLNPTVNEDDVVTFKDATGYSAPTQWAWHFLTETKNTVTKFGNETTYKYSEAGTYPVSLVVTNKFGCIDTVVKSIILADDYGLFIPNAFTPNSDGVNDTFLPKGHGIKSYTLVIFNRWGEQIYKTNQLENGWDGYYKGELSKSDVYTWKINCVDGKNKSHEIVGSLSLLR